MMSKQDPFRDTDKLMSIIAAGETTSRLEEKHRAEMSRLLLAVVRLVDSLQALHSHSQNGTTDGAHSEAVDVMLRQVLAALAEAGVVPMKANHQPLNLDHYEVVAVRADTQVEDDLVVEEVVQGYLWNNEPLRRAKVVVARSLGSTTTATGDEG